ncbi:MAG: hypothetical protein H6626_06385 [Pseudobdellovibrionaceae bacterium]|nr:hypothetical protein [Bdellovibrionales bacterium]USN48714.1 MAG: hypothetical protein H6626_06385 [Pseudobdellovibrionaceae bacterium]
MKNSYKIMGLVQLLTVALVFAFQACSQVKFTTLGYSEDPKKVCVDEGTASESCFNEYVAYSRSEQPQSQISDKLDILFVMDTSGSLDNERAEIVNNVDQFVSRLSLGVNYQIGVLLAHGSSSAHSGRLYQKSSEPVVLNPAQLTTDELRQHLSTKLSRPAGDSVSDGGEEGLFSLHQLLNGDRLQAARDVGFFRAGTALAVVFLSDENDICAQYPNGVTPKVDPDKKEGPAFLNDCQNPSVTAESTYQELLALQNGAPLLVGGIIYTGGSAVPVNNEDEIGYGYIDIIDINKGPAIDLGAGNLANGLAVIGEMTQLKLDIITEFLLVDPVRFANLTRPDQIMADTIKVQVDGHDVPFTFEPSTGAVHIASQDAGSGGSQVVIEFRYRILIPGASN